MITVKTNISVHSFALFKIFMNANFGELVDVGYYNKRMHSFASENFIMYSYNNDNLDFDFIRIKLAFNGYTDLEKAFLDYERVVRCH